MKKKMINAVTSSETEPICKKTTFISVEEIENNNTNTSANVETSVVTTTSIVIVENAEPPVVEKKKRGRKKLIKPDLLNISNIVTSTENVSIMDPSAPPPVVVHKKRGRKPRGGKIIQETLVHNNNVPELPNIILHLKCVTSDLNAANHASITGSETVTVKHDNEIMCYNDQTVCGSEVCNYTDSSTDSVDSDSPIRAIMSDYEPDNNNNNNNNYDPSTFANCCSTSTCDSSSSSQLFTDWKDKHKQNYQHDDSADSDNNATMKDIWKKISQLKISYNKNDTFQIIGSHRSACFWCTCDFDTPAIYIPKSMVKDMCNVYGCFCHPECAVAFLMNENIDTSIKFERYHLLNSMYGPIYNYDKSIKPAPNPYYLLNKFYGNLSIIEYRKLFKSEQLIYMVNKPLTHILPELYEDNNDFLVGNKIIQNNNIRKNQLKKKSNKTNIINEVFGVK